MVTCPSAWLIPFLPLVVDGDIILLPGSLGASLDPSPLCSYLDWVPPAATQDIPPSPMPSPLEPSPSLPPFPCGARPSQPTGYDAVSARLERGSSSHSAHYLPPSRPALRQAAVLLMLFWDVRRNRALLGRWCYAACAEGMCRCQFGWVVLVEGGVGALWWPRGAGCLVGVRCLS